MSETVLEIVDDHRTGRSKPADTVARTFERIRTHGDPAVFISLAEEEVAIKAAKSLDASAPLYGIPVAVKDNIDVRGMPTTAACPAFSYMPERDAAAVGRLKAAGAIIVGKTNLDQFATGLVGVRSPYGTPRNPFNADLIPGGSSSGSAVAVATGLVPLALGTDTAGSGRVPAGLNNIVGLKPSLGLIPATGVVPACRSLDCVSIFALTTDDAWDALQVMAGKDAGDSYSRDFTPGSLGEFPRGITIGVPQPKDRHFFGDKNSEQAFTQSIDLAKSLGATIADLDFSHFLEAARLLYEGPWVAERTAAVGDFIAKHPGEIHPVTREIIAAGEKVTGADAFRAFYRMQDLRAKSRATLAEVPVLMIPTVPRAYTVAELQSEPFRLNANLGTYTNFVNLLDLSGIAVPAVFSGDTPYGVTFLAGAGEEAKLASVGRAFHAASKLPLGALDLPQPSPRIPAQAAANEIFLAVVGAHLSGMALNGELTSLGGRLVETTRTSRDYRLFALQGTNPPKPGLLRVADGMGEPIEVEVWSLSAESFGRFVAAVPSPLSIGTMRLDNGKTTKGFLVEATAVEGARDITSFGGWRAFVAATK